MRKETNLTKEEVIKTHTEEYKQLKVEFNRASFKALLEQEKGKTCVCCGSTLGVEYHHMLPLSLGGDNRLSNIYPVCNSCHKIIHGGRVNKLWRNDNKGGRKKKPPKGYKIVLDRYFNCEIGRKECQEILEVAGANKLTDKWWFKDYIKECGIKRFRNNIDLINANGVMCEGRIVGEIVYNNGEVQFMYSDAYIQSHKEYEQMSFV